LFLALLFRKNDEPCFFLILDGRIVHIKILGIEIKLDGRILHMKILGIEKNYTLASEEAMAPCQFSL
jgi:hypothetical protein